MGRSRSIPLLSSSGAHLGFCVLVLLFILRWFFLGGSGGEGQRGGSHQGVLQYPPGISNQYDEERDFLKFHRCSNEGEAFSGSWLVTKEHFMSYNLSYGLSQANAELAAFLVVETRRSKKAWYPVGALMQTLDVLDLSVIHLSAYERLYRKYEYDLEEEAVATEIQESMRRITQRLRSTAPIAGKRNAQRGTSNGEPTISFKEFYQQLTSSTTIASKSQGPSPRLLRSKQTLAMLPWLGSTKGEGHSEVKFRLMYLEACFWSIAQLSNNIIVGVASEEDKTLIQEAGLPTLEIVVFSRLPSLQALPAALVQHVRQGSNRGGSYETFDYFYYSESDQVVVVHPGMKDELFGFLDKYTRRVLVPHRLVPYPPAIVALLNRTTSRPHAMVSRYDLTQNELPNPHLAYHSKIAASILRHNVTTASFQDIVNAFYAKLFGGPLRAIPLSGDKEDITPNWKTLKCCLPRQNCELRGDWVSPTEPALPFVDVFGLSIALGNANFKDEKFRACTISPLGGLCP